MLLAHLVVKQRAEAVRVSARRASECVSESEGARDAPGSEGKRERQRGRDRGRERVCVCASARGIENGFEGAFVVHRIIEGFRV